MVVQNFKWPSLITGLASKFDFRESGRATFNPSIKDFLIHYVVAKIFSIIDLNTAFGIDSQK